MRNTPGMMRFDGAWKSLLVLRTIFALVVAGCSGGQGAPGLGGGGEGEGEREGDEVGLPAPPVPAPAYFCRSRFDVGAGLLLPETADDALAALEGLGEHPGETILDLAETAGVPAVGDVRDALPAAAEDELTGFIDDQINSAESEGQGSAADRIAGLTAEIRGSLASFELQTALAMPAAGQGTGRHSVEAIVLSPLSEDPIHVPAEIVAIAGTDEVAVTVEADQVGLGEHAFGLPVGEIALEAVDEIVSRTTGAPDLRAALGGIVDCDAVAEAVAEQCVAFVCIGHEVELRAVCEGALDQAAAEIEARLLSLDVDVVHLLSGTGTLVAGGARYETIANGAWDARLNAGMGERESHATFACSAR